MSTGVAIQEPETVTFYSWIGTTPSSQIIHISGGGRMMDGSGEVIKTPDKFAKFHNGVHQSADPETIAMLRHLASKPGNGITEDRELFYQATMTKEQMVKRQTNLNNQLNSELAQAKDEISRLRKQLEKAGGRKDA